MQKYCGCVFSEEDRFMRHKKDKATVPMALKSDKNEE